LTRLPASCRVDRTDSAAFVGGQRIRVRRGIDQDAALRAIAELQALGALVELEANRPAEAALVGLEEIDRLDGGGPAAAEGAAAEAALDTLRDELKALYGDTTGERGHSDPAAPTVPGRGGSNPALQLDEPTQPLSRRDPTPAGVSIGEEQLKSATELLQKALGANSPATQQNLHSSATQQKPPPPTPQQKSNSPATQQKSNSPAAQQRANSPATQQKFATNAAAAAGGEEDATTVDADPDARFRAPSLESAAMQLELDQRPPAPPPPPSPSEVSARASAIPRCPKHDEPLDDTGLCAECAEEAKPVPGRLFQGALRRKPIVRAAIGVGLGLLLGYFLSEPYASRAERRVADLKAQANADRYRPGEEIRAQVAALDREADSQSSRAAFGTIAIWLAVAGAVAGGWYRAT